MQANKVLNINEPFLGADTPPVPHGGYALDKYWGYLVDRAMEMVCSIRRKS